MLIGTPALTLGLYQRGVEASLDAMREQAGINTVLAYVNTLQLRQYRPGFGPNIDEATGRPTTDVYVRTHDHYYGRTPLKHRRNPDTLWNDRDIFDELAELAPSRGMKVYARILEPYVITGAIPGMEACAEIDADGRPGENVCYNHPDYMAYWEAVVTDLIESHPSIEGFKFGQERGGPLFQALNGDTATCFCPHCVKLASERGLNITAARAGMKALQAYAAAHTQPAGSFDESLRPRDGYFATFLRLLSQYPELLAWERFWMDSRENQRRRIYAVIKKIRPSVQVGWHIDHGMSWNIFARANLDYAAMVPHSDWLSIAVYFDCMGPRSFNHFRRNYERLLFADSRPSLGHAFYFSMLGFDPQSEPSYDEQLAQPRPLGADYVYAETRRAVLGVRAAGGKTRVHARIGFDVPLKPVFEISSDQVYQATTRALEAGADGLWLGREWDELKPAGIAGFDRAVRDWKKARG